MPADFNYYRPQYFSFSSSLSYYISKNHISADGLLKIQKTCKYFFAKNKIVVVNRGVDYESDGNHLFLTGLIDDEEIKYCLKDYNEFKFWLTGSLTISSIKFLKTVKYIYRCDFQQLAIFDRKNSLTLKEIDFLLNGGKVEELTIFSNIFDDENGTIVSCDKILSKTPDIIIFNYTNKNNEIFTSENFHKMNALKFKSKFTNFFIGNFAISPDADITLLGKFIEKNGKAKSKFYFDFKRNNSGLDRFRKTINEMFETWDTKEKPIIRIIT